jgi:hypothetical protein
MTNQSKKTDSRKLGWLAAGMLSFILSSPAWALDLDQEIARAESQTPTVSYTLSHGQHQVDHASKDTKKKLKLSLIRKKKVKKYV